MLDRERIKQDSDTTDKEFFWAEVHDSVIDARKERDKFQSEAKNRTDEVMRLLEENASLKTDNALLEDADTLRNVGMGIVSVCGALTLFPLESFPLLKTGVSSVSPGIWLVIYTVSIIGGISAFVCGVWLRREKRKTAVPSPH